MTNVGDILQKKASKDVITIHPDATLHEASTELAQHSIGVLVVVDRNGLPMGILSERDIVRKMGVVEDISDIGKYRVRDVMTEDVITTHPGEELSNINRIMTDNRIRHLPVMSGGRLVGLVSIGDVVEMQLDYFETEARQLKQYVTGGYA